MSCSEYAPKYAPKSARTSVHQPMFNVRLWVWEFLLTCLSLVLLVTFAKPLGEGERPLGSDRRYVATADAALSFASGVNTTTRSERSWTEALHFPPAAAGKNQRAEWLNRHAGAVLLIFSACGWISLSFGRSIVGVGVKLPLIVATWCFSGHLLAIYSARWVAPGLAKSFDQLLAAINLWLLFAAAMLLVALWNGCRSIRLPRRHLQFHSATASPWVFPGFVLFSSIGWLWITDWAARGHLDKQYVGIYQTDSLWLAYVVFTLVASHQGQMLAAMSRFASWLDRLSTRWISMPNGLLFAGLLVWIGLLVAIGHLNTGDAGNVKVYRRHAAVLAEAMRLPIWLALGWLIYRFVETGQRVVQGMFAVVALLLVLVLGLKLNNDGGPILAQLVCVVWVFFALAQAGLARKYSPMLSWSLAVSGAVRGTAAAIWLAFIMAPEDRLVAMELKYTGKQDFLSVLHWFMDATPATGFGLGRTPWCGFEYVAGLAAECHRSGVPPQIQSDYVASALLATFGFLATLLLLIVLMLWLWELARKGPAIHIEALNFGLLRQWVLIGFAVTSAAQVAISVAGTLGVMPLTGLAFPAGLSLGGAGLLSTAFFAGLSVNSIYLKKSFQKS